MKSCRYFAAVGSNDNGMLKIRNTRTVCCVLVALQKIMAFCSL